MLGSPSPQSSINCDSCDDLWLDLDLALVHPPLRGQLLELTRFLVNEVKISLDGTDATLAHALDTRPSFEPEFAQILYDTNMDVPEFLVGMTFKNATEFKEALGKYEIRKRYALKYTRNTKQYVRMRCTKEKCP